MTLSELTLLGIETSCDETAAAVVQRRVDSDGTVRGTILSNVIRSQFDAHAAYGGVVPEIAARAHVTVLDGIIRQAMVAAGTDWDDLSGIAVTSGPGLIGGLLVGTVTAQAIATARGLPLVGINHLEGHALTATLTDATAFPYLLLLVSGGHTQILLVSGIGQYQRLGSTIDDALGEAFDKVAKMLDLGFPGGPAVEAAARSGEAGRFDLPRPLWKKAGCNFSFSGLKTALRHRAEACAPLTDRDIADLCAGFQAAVCDVLAD
ncbi:MAG: tRNA (adenosine(37)-N6)-threonylcarbamoyltransferase complex transferase subunit TsaD, partial [Alphaproteobacteria bacterium]